MSTYLRNLYVDIYPGARYNIHEVITVATTEAQKRATQKHQAKLDSITLRPPKEEGRLIRDAAIASGKPLQTYILDIVRDHMKQAGGE